MYYQWQCLVLLLVICCNFLISNTYFCSFLYIIFCADVTDTQTPRVVSIFIGFPCVSCVETSSNYSCFMHVINTVSFFKNVKCSDRDRSSSSSRRSDDDRSRSRHRDDKDDRSR
jgi:hypothetical protein